MRSARVQVGTSAAPLRKELMDSGLGEALVGGGLQGDLRQPVFSIGLKGAAPENFEKVGAPGAPAADPGGRLKESCMRTAQVHSDIA